jgi:sugar phosphate isomerase/epimerase
VRLAVSNIAWPREHDTAVADVLREFGVTGIEVAPTKVWGDPRAATDAEVDAYRRRWEARGVRIVAAQALLFGRPELTLFDSLDVRRRTLDHLAAVVRVCGRAGAGSLVFGSPKNRRAGHLPRERAWDIAIGFFRELATIAADHGTAIVMEANPPEYGADFVTTAAEAVELVRAVDHPGFRLHLDTACMTLAGDAIAATFDAAYPLLRHFHASEPNLGPPGSSGRVDHRAFAAELAAHGYAGWVSLEMREPEPFTLDGMAAAVRWLTRTYSPEPGAGDGPE